MIHARPNPNGNTPEDFAAAYVALQNARTAIDAAASKLLCDVANGRNYQHLADPDDAVIADRRQIQEAHRQANALLGTLQSDLVDALDQ